MVELAFWGSDVVSTDIHEHFSTMATEIGRELEGSGTFLV
jgi:hypothetical protein